MISFSLKTDRSKVDAALAELRRGISDWSPAWPLVAEVFRGIARGRFETEGASGASGAWAPLSDPYAKVKARKFPGKAILRANDRLFSSLTGFVEGDSVFESEPQKLTLGTRVEYATYHQSATAGGKLPRRAVLDLVAGRDDRAIAAVLSRYGQQLAQQAGLAVRESEVDAAGGATTSTTFGNGAGRTLAGETAAPLSGGI